MTENEIYKLKNAYWCDFTFFQLTNGLCLPDVRNYLFHFIHLSFIYLFTTCGIEHPYQQECFFHRGTLALKTKWNITMTENEIYKKKMHIEAILLSLNWQTVYVFLMFVIIYFILFIYHLFIYLLLVVWNTLISKSAFFIEVHSH